MTTLEILKTRKDEIVNLTLELLPKALSGDTANRTFFFKVDEETGELTVDYLYYLGLRSLNDNCFYTIPNHKTPAPEEFGYETIGDMDFEACGYASIIENEIDNKIAILES